MSSSRWSAGCLDGTDGTQYSPSRLHHSLLLSTSYNISPSALPCTPWMIPTTQTSFRTRSVKGLRREFDSPNGGEHSTLSPICTRDLHNAVTSSPPLPPLLRSAHTLCDPPQRTFNPEKSKNGKRFWKVPAPFPNSPPQKLSGFTENLS